MKSTNSVPSKRILLVEDEQVVREVVRHVLRSDQHTVVEANNGAEAFGLFCQQPFDLVVTDHQMPFLAGSELAVRIRQMAPNQPIIMLSGHRSRPGRDNPVNTVLPKPLNPSALRLAIAELTYTPGGE